MNGVVFDGCHLGRLMPSLPLCEDMIIYKFLFFIVTLHKIQKDAVVSFGLCWSMHLIQKCWYNNIPSPLSLLRRCYFIWCLLLLFLFLISMVATLICQAINYSLLLLNFLSLFQLQEYQICYQFCDRISCVFSLLSYLLRQQEKQM